VGVTHTKPVFAAGYSRYRIAALLRRLFSLFLKIICMVVIAVVPESFQIIKSAVFLVEDVHQNITEILNDPAGGGVPFGLSAEDTLLAHLFIQRVGQGLHLGYIAAADYQKTVGYNGILLNIEKNDIHTLSIIQHMGQLVG
jgi:hypothetical protein